MEVNLHTAINLENLETTDYVPEMDLFLAVNGEEEIQNCNLEIHGTEC